MKKRNNIRLRKDGRYEARYEKGRTSDNKIIYGYCYGQTYQEAEEKRNQMIAQIKPLKELNLLILGAGSHGQEVYEIAKLHRIFGKIDFLDDDESKNPLGPCKDFEKYLSEYKVAIAAVGDKSLRIKWMYQLVEAGFVIPTLVHPAAIISDSAQINCGTVICAMATIGTNAKIGKGCIISSGATIKRNVILEDWQYVDYGEVVNH